MRLIQPSCRVQITAEDVDFILGVLQPGVASSECLERLLGDEDTRDLVLDDDKLFHAVLEQPQFLKISTHLYFYILVRQVLRQSGVQDRRVADYVAELLSDFSKSEHTQWKPGHGAPPLAYFCDMLAALHTADDITQFYLRAHVGNLSLFMVGVFPESLRHRTRYRGAPSLAFYEELGRSNFHVASHHRLARTYNLADLYLTLARSFHQTRKALNELGDRLLALGDPEPPGHLLA